MADRGSTAVAYRAILLAAALLVFGLLFQELLTLLLAILMTTIFAIALSAIAKRLERLHVPRPIGTLVALLGVLAALAGIFALLIPAFIDQTNQFADAVPGIADDLRQGVQDVTGAEPGEVSNAIQEFADRFEREPELLIGPLTSIGLGVAGVLGALLVMLLTAFYIAMNPDPLVEGIRRLVPPPWRSRAETIMERLRTSWIGWLEGVAVDMVISGVLLYIGLSIVGLELAIFFAVLTALLTVIPYFGSIIGAIPPLLFALTDSPGKAALVLVIYVVVQQISGNVTIPLVMSRMVKLHPAVIAFGVVVVGQLFGFVGLFVAVPILSLIVILVEEVWVNPMEAAYEEAGPDAPSPLELDGGDHDGGDDADHDHDLEEDPEGGHRAPA